MLWNLMFVLALGGCVRTYTYIKTEPHILAATTNPLPADYEITQSAFARACGADYQGLHLLLKQLRGEAYAVVQVAVEEQRHYRVTVSGAEKDVQLDKSCWIASGYRVRIKDLSTEPEPISTYQRCINKETEDSYILSITEEQSISGEPCTEEEVKVQGSAGCGWPTINIVDEEIERIEETCKQLELEQ
jgi:hypothetical protein